MTKNLTQKTQINYECEDCRFKTRNKYDYSRHLLTRKHINTIKYNENTQKNAIFENFSCKCGKSYPYKASLYNHKKRCKHLEEKEEKEEKKENIIITDENDIDYKTMFFKLMNDNKELQKTITEMIPKIGNINNNINQKFNINLFLNEECKDALTMEQFINKIEVSISNLLLTKDKGIDEGISNIFIENMNKLSLYERPMHCSDTKRETVYIKSENNDSDSKWEKDKENTKLKKAIKNVAHVQQKNLIKWVEEHPGWENNQDLQDEYMKLIKSCTDDITDKKVIKKLCNSCETKG
jgi:hypothetical protein